VEEFKPINTKLMEFNLKDLKFFSYMTESFGQMMQRINRKEIEMVKGMISGLMRAYKDAKEKYDGPSIAHHFHNRIDQHVDRMIEGGKKEGKNVTCGNNCGFCCFQRVDITSDEALLLNGIAEERGIKLDENVMEQQMACKDHKDHIKLPPKIRKCMFLDENMSCKVYEYRPGSCRTVLVISDPKGCDTEENLGGQITRLNHISAEGELIATHMAADETGGMALMLNKYRKDEKRRSST
jgi:Fe-S-cluster containining protein